MRAHGNRRVRPPCGRPCWLNDCTRERTGPGACPYDSPHTVGCTPDGLPPWPPALKFAHISIPPQLTFLHLEFSGVAQLLPVSARLRFSSRFPACLTPSKLAQ